MRNFLALLLVVLVCLGGCDNGGTDDPPPPPTPQLFEATVTTPDGNPVSDLDLFVRYSPSGAVSEPSNTREGGLITVAFPNPTTSSLKIEVRSVLEVDVRAEVFNLEGIRVGTPFNETVPIGVTDIVLDPVSFGPSAVHRVLVESIPIGRIQSKTRYIARTEGEQDGSLLLKLGRTDGQGRVVVTERMRFPSFYDLPDFDVRNENGIFVAFLPFTNSVTLVLRDDNGGEVTMPYTLDSDANDVSMTWAP